MSHFHPLHFQSFKERVLTSETHTGIYRKMDDAEGLHFLWQFLELEDDILKNLRASPAANLWADILI